MTSWQKCSILLHVNIHFLWPLLFFQWQKIPVSKILLSEHFQNFNKMVNFISGSCRKNVFQQNLSYRSFTNLGNWRGSAHLNFSNSFKKLRYTKILYYKLVTKMFYYKLYYWNQQFVKFFLQNSLFKKIWKSV